MFPAGLYLLSLLFYLLLDPGLVDRLRLISDVTQRLNTHELQ